MLNRELSQFGSFITIDDNTQSIGIGTTTLPYVGIGTTNPVKKLHVVGDTLIDGGLEINGTFTFDLGEIDFSNTLNDFDIYTSGVVTAREYYNTSGGILTSFDSWSVSGSNIYRQSGNVGLGLVNPQEKLDVLGNIQVSNQFISNVAGTRVSGTPPFQVESSYVVANLNATYLQNGIPGGTASGDIVTIDGTQTLTNKSFSGTGVVFNGSSSGNTTLRATPAAGSGSVLLPTTNGTLICSGDTGTVTSGMIANGTIINDDINANAAIAYGKLNLNNSITNNDLAGSIANNKLVNSTISGVSLGSNLFNLTNGSYITYDSGTTYNGSAARTIAVDATNLATANKVVARDNVGGFSAVSISLSGNLSAISGTVSGSTLSAGIGGISASGVVNITNTQNATSTTTGALRVGGGLGVANDTYIGGLLRNTNTTNSTSTTTGALVVSGGLGVASNTYIGGLLNVSATSQLANTTISGITSITNSENSTSTTTGALRVAGGVGVVNDVFIGGNLNVTGTVTVGSGGLTQILHLRHTEDRNVAGGSLSAGTWQKRKLNTSVTNSVANSSFDSVNFEFVLPSGSYDVNITVPAYSVNTHQSRITSTAGNSVTIYGTTEYANQPAGADKSQGFSRSTIRGIINITTPTTFQIQHRVESSQTTNGGGLPTSFGTGGNLQPGTEIYTEVFIRKLT